MFKDLKVLELSSVLAGPAVGMFFSELGASVLKVENKLTGGDVTRNWKLPIEKENELSAYFSSVNYKKTHVFLDFNSEIDRKELNQLIKSCDIIITNFKSGDEKKFKLDFKSCKKINDHIIYAKITGFKSNTKRVAYDIVLQAETGYISMTGNNKEYAKMPVAFIDVLAAHQLKEGILTALILQNQEKKPYKVSTTLEETAIASLMNQSSNYLMANHQSKPMGTLHPNIAPYGEIVTTIDNKELILAIGTDHQFENFSKIISLDISIVKKFKTNPKRVKKRIELLVAIKEKIKSISSQYLLSSCLKKNIPIGEINSIKKVLESKLAKEMVLEEKINNQLTKRIKTVAFNLTS
jgi:crotonobetainyl-CoA:carnitine CoA-transferase CaiB-like acyl-CoA transferase